MSDSGLNSGIHCCPVLALTLAGHSERVRRDDKQTLYASEFQIKSSGIIEIGFAYLGPTRGKV